LNIGEEDAGRLHEIEEEYRRGPLAGRTNTAVTASAARSKRSWRSSRLKKRANI
jgi:hypothetical protein